MQRISLILFISVTLSICKTEIPESFATDNQLQTNMDSVVHRTAIKLMDDRMIGLSLGIYKNGEISFYNYGSIEKNKQVLPTRNTIYEIGSITKTFTGILLAQAVQENKLSLNDDIRLYLDPKFDNLEYGGDPIRIVNLANHTSGLPEDFIPEEFFKLENPTMFDIIHLYDKDRGELFLNDLEKTKPDTLPGQRIVYSNAGMITLGIILENIYGISYPELIIKYFAGPMSMKNTETVFYKSETDNYTKGYDKDGNVMPHITFQIAGAAGGLKSTTGDMILFIKENLTDINKVVKLAHKSTIAKNGQELGLGWQISKSNSGEKQLWHDGGEPGFSSYIAIVPGMKTGIICLTNQRGRQYLLSNLSSEILSGIKNNHFQEH